MDYRQGATRSHPALATRAALSRSMHVRDYLARLRRDDELCDLRQGRAQQRRAGKLAILQAASRSSDAPQGRQPRVGSDFAIKTDLVLLAMGFVHPVHEGLLKSRNVDGPYSRNCGRSGNLVFSYWRSRIRFSRNGPMSGAICPLSSAPPTGSQNALIHAFGANLLRHRSSRTRRPAGRGPPPRARCRRRGRSSSHRRGPRHRTDSTELADLSGGLSLRQRRITAAWTRNRARSVRGQTRELV
jgi:hypothetical protein